MSKIHLTKISFGENYFMKIFSELTKNIISVRKGEDDGDHEWRQPAR
jgi:hypothetical protein